MNKAPGVLSLCMMVLGMSLGVPPVLHGQKQIKAKINKIQNNTAYKWGEATDKDLEKARSRSMDDLLQKIQVSLFSNTSFKEVVIANDDSSYGRIEFENKISSFSSMVLIDIERLEEKVWRKKWRVFTYIAKSSIDKSIKLREGKILEYMKAGLVATSEGRINETLRNYYWGYLLAKSQPQGIKTAGGKNIYGNVEFTKLINATLQDIDINPEEPFFDGRNWLIRLSCTYNDKPITELSFKYFYKGNEEYGRVDDGEETLALSGASDRPVSDLTLFIEYKNKGAMSADKEIMLLESIFGQRSSFSNRKPVRFRLQEERKPEYGQLPSFRTEAVDVLLENRHDLDIFKQILLQYIRLGHIQSLTSKEISTCDDCILAVIDDGYIADMLYYNGSYYIGVENARINRNVASQYQGKKLIWFKERP